MGNCDEPARSTERYSVLGHDEVCSLVRTVQRGIDAEQLLDSERVDELSPAEREAAERAVKAGCEAKCRVVEHNLRLVASIACRYNVDGMTMEDHFQTGCFGLHRAVEKFDPDLGLQFSTYATWWIRQSIMRAIADQARIIRLPVHVVEAMAKVQRVQERLLLESGRAPIGRIAEITDMTPAKVEMLLRLLPGAGSLDAVVGDGLTTIGDLVPAEPADDSMEGVPEALAEALEGLTPREREIVELRFGLGDDESRTLEKVGQAFGVTRERIRQIEKKALDKMRPSLRRSLEIPESRPEPEIESTSSAMWPGSADQGAFIETTSRTKVVRAIDALIEAGGSMPATELVQRFGRSNVAYVQSVVDALDSVCRELEVPNPMRYEDDVVSVDPRFRELWLR